MLSNQSVRSIIPIVIGNLLKRLWLDKERIGMRLLGMTEGDASSENWKVCPCNICSRGLEFDPAHAGETIQCPHCGMETVLFIPKATVSPLIFTSETQSSGQQPPQITKTVIATTGNEISGRTIDQYIGIVRGVVVRSPDIVQGMFGGLKQIVGGNIESYAKVCDAARQEAFSRMIAHAREMNADAVIAFRYDATEFAQGVTEVLAYGTAVKLVERKF